MYQNNPFIVDETPGKKFYCTCGGSNNMPYCDANHGKVANGKKPVMVEIKEAKKVAICGCGKSTSSPFCDGSHLK
jgi:CDGSH-type Zn-finger protein